MYIFREREGVCVCVEGGGGGMGSKIKIKMKNYTSTTHPFTMLKNTIASSGSHNSKAITLKKKENNN